MEFLNHAIEVISNLSASALIGSVSVVLEVVLRLVPSEKPKSLLLGVKALVSGAAHLLEAVNGLLDKVIPQNLK